MNKLLSNSEKKENLNAGEIICIPSRPRFWHSGDDTENPLKDPINLVYPIYGKITKLIIIGSNSQLHLLYDNSTYGFALYDTDIIKVNNSEISII